MKHPRILMLSCASVLLAAGSAHAQLSLNGVGGGPIPGNYGTLPGTTPFAKDSLAAGTHSIPNLNNGVYGNADSWIANSANSFAGLSFGTTLRSIGQIAWGRDNLPVTGFFDRSAGNYTLQYTTVANPNELTPDASWTTIGTASYEINMVKRALWSFPQVNATGIRLVTSNNGTCIDELEVGAFAPVKLTLQATGGTMRAGNIALDANGALAFNKDLLGNGSFQAHQTNNLNDGLYGNPESWIGNSDYSFAGVKFASAQTIDRIAFGRDNLPAGALTDRDSGNYLIQYTTQANPDASTTDWVDIGAWNFSGADPTAHQRHEFSFAPVAGATGVRIIAPGNGIGTGRAIDEIEVYAVPEPASAAFLLIGGAALASRRRRR